MDVAELEKKLKSKDIAALSRAITLNESTRIEDNILIDNIIARNTSALDQSLIIAISGIPGVGKSSFIDVLGTYLHSLGKSIAVFSIDPSSEISHGSILGDKTRMHHLAQLSNVFIRPSPSSNKLGGLGINTHKNIELAQIAGYDIILIETVGVGQSETLVRKLCDIFILLSMPSSGDELQGIKKGIMEIADFFIINKADGDLAIAAEKTKKEILSALEMTRSQVVPSQVRPFSSLSPEGVEVLWQDILNYTDILKENNQWYQNRQEQQKYWAIATFEAILQQHVLQQYHTQIESIGEAAYRGEYVSLEAMLSMLREQ